MKKLGFMSLKLIVGCSILSIMALSSCSPSKDSRGTISTSSTSLIVNGRPVLASELFLKHTVAVAPANDKAPCTGVIIAPHFILSAGHCANYFKGGHIYFGLVADEETAITYNIKNVTRHPQYCDSCMYNGEKLAKGNDLSIIEFAENLPEGFEPVPLAEIDKAIVSETVYLSGYGLNEQNIYDKVLKVTQVPISLVGDSEFMTDEKESGSCNGDSGGPAFIQENDKLILVGITSRGDNFCRKNGVYTIPAAHAKWINTVIGNTP